MAKLPCFLCGKDIPVKTDKNKKRYLICNPCGAQIFIRRKEGMEKLEELIALLNDQDFVMNEHSHNLFVIQAILSEIRGIREQINKIENKSDFFAKDDEIKLRKQTLKLLNSRIENLLSQLAQIAEKVNPENK
jgi:DNA-directed RNA polymerase subunit RPC12/RpoP